MESLRVLYLTGLFAAGDCMDLFSTAAFFAFFTVLLLAPPLV
jgi:hypothetical protein